LFGYLGLNPSAVNARGMLVEVGWAQAARRVRFIAFFSARTSHRQHVTVVATARKLVILI